MIVVGFPAAQSSVATRSWRPISPRPTCAARAPGWVQLADDAVFGVPRDRGEADR